MTLTDCGGREVEGEEAPLNDTGGDDDDTDNSNDTSHEGDEERPMGDSQLSKAEWSIPRSEKEATLKGVVGSVI